MRRSLGVLGVFAVVLGAAACGIKSAPRPPLSPDSAPAATAQPSAQGDVSRGPLPSSIPPPDSGTP